MLHGRGFIAKNKDKTVQKLFSHMKKNCTLWTKVLEFVSGFLLVSNVGRKMAAQNLLKGGVLWLKIRI